MFFFNWENMYSVGFCVYISIGNKGGISSIKDINEWFYLKMKVFINDWLFINEITEFRGGFLW